MIKWKCYICNTEFISDSKDDIMEHYIDHSKEQDWEIIE